MEFIGYHRPPERRVMDYRISINQIPFSHVNVFGQRVTHRAEMRYQAFSDAVGIRNVIRHCSSDHCGTRHKRT
jgi:hypothetical protein